MSVTTVLYKDIAPGADEDASVSTTEAMSFSSPSKLPFGITPEPTITCEPNHWGLTGEYVTVDTQEVAFWSVETSGDDCNFTNKPVITLEMDQQYSSVGITLAFDTASGDYCPSVNIKWYQGEALKADVDFTPNTAMYFCGQKVQSYDKVVITLNSTNLPNLRAKLEHIIFGVYRYFGMSELRSASIVNEMSLISMEMPISTMNWTLDSREDVDFMFQLKQPVEVRNDDKLIGVYYIDSHTRQAQNLYTIDCQDAFGVLDDSPFPGGVYNAKSAKSLLEEIVNGQFSIEYNADVEDTALTGVITSGTIRTAIQQVLFAWGVCASTDGRDGIRVFNLPGTPDAITEDYTFTGVTVDTSALVTEVRVTAHVYTQAENGGVEINGVKYDDSKTVYTITNPDVIATDKQNVIEVADATLVSPDIGQATAQRVYDYYAKRITTNAKIVWAGELLGDCVTLPTAWGTTNAGNLRRMEVKLSNTVVATVASLGG